MQDGQDEALTVDGAEDGCLDLAVPRVAVLGVQRRRRPSLRVPVPAVGDKRAVHILERTVENVWLDRGAPLHVVVHEG